MVVQAWDTFRRSAALLYLVSKYAKVSHATSFNTHSTLVSKYAKLSHATSPPRH